VRIVGLAAGTRDARRATAWLQRATRAGADVALIADTETPGIRVRRIGRIGMLPAIRALEAEHRLGAVDALLVVGWRGRILAQLLPGRVRGTATPAIPDEEPATAVRRIVAAARSSVEVNGRTRWARRVHLR
jgi:hypothetical protein